VRLGVYADLVYRQEHGRISTDRAFILFVTGLAPRLGEVVVFGRLDPQPGTSDYVLPQDGVRFVPLPHYPKVTAVRKLVRVLRRTGKTFESELSSIDAVWIFGPYPVSMVLARICQRRHVPFALGIRQDFPSYVRNRLPSRRWLWAVPVAEAFEQAFRLVAHRVPTVAVGSELAEAYAGGRAPVLAAGFSLVPADAVVEVGDALDRSWDGELRILSVGRIDREKNPLLLAEILALLRAASPRWRLVVAGRGPLEVDLRRRADELGVADAIDLVGYVPAGPRLWNLYRSCNAFLHVSLTEGLPQVLFEAKAAGLAIVATDVGGVRGALDDGRVGLLVPPRDAAAAARALERIAHDERLRRGLVIESLARARDESMDRQLDRIAGFLETNLAAQN